MKIGELAERTGLSSSTLRYYESRGLLPATRRTEAGYREYDDGSIERVETVLAAKRLGFSLVEIRRMLNVAEEPDRCETISLFAKARVRSIKEAIARMTEIERLLTERLDACARGQRSESGPCPIITGRSQEDFMEEQMTNSKITIYSATCGLCEEAARIVRDAVAPCGCSVEVKPVDSDEARALGVKSAPTIVRDGKIVFCGRPTSEEAIEALRRSA
ncbi:MAG: MerR family transcriptional regulator [Armatimonadetes bacterium]|nr:MerR family transcriptional regulator [Armatimonadota bacterium]